MTRPFVWSSYFRGSTRACRPDLLGSTLDLHEYQREGQRQNIVLRLVNLLYVKLSLFNVFFLVEISSFASPVTSKS